MLRSFFKSIVDEIIFLACNRFTSKPRVPKTLLIFRKDGLGDYIIFYPYLKYLKSFFKDYKITLVVPKVAMGLSPILKDFGEIIEFDTKRFSGNIFYRYSLIRHLAKAGYEIAMYPVFSREPIGDMIIELTGAKRKVGFQKYVDADKVYSDLVRLPNSIALEINRNREFARHFGPVPDELTFPTIDINAFPTQTSDTILKENKLSEKNFCVVFPGTGAVYKKWPIEKFAKICDYMVEKGIQPVLCGGDEDVDSCRKIIHKSKNRNVIINLSSQTDIGTLAHILKHSLFYFGNDTGALHLASAVNTAAICIMGGGHFGRFFPYGDLNQNRIVYDASMPCKCDDWQCASSLKPDEEASCMKNITVEAAAKEINELLHYLRR